MSLLLILLSKFAVSAVTTDPTTTQITNIKNVNERLGQFYYNNTQEEQLAIFQT